MKAVILAGGEGSRLRPLTLGRPKPMTPLFGKPVLGHLLDLLRRHGVTQAAVTLRYLPNMVMDYFGDGSAYGVELKYFVEDLPLGTAGSVRQCLDYLGEEDFLLLSGDGVCDLDLTAFMEKHKKSGAVASLALSRREQPLDYGLVRVDKDSRITGFVEKPGWGQVDTERVNTGVYALSPKCFELIPEAIPQDFGRDIFPTLLSMGEDLRGWTLPGYWQDMGDCGAYLDCVRDALAGRVMLDLETGRTEAPAGVEVREPCWIGKRVSLSPGAVVGPYAAIGEGSTVETGAVVERSVLLGGHVGEGAEVTGAILCKGARLHRRSMISAGAVLGEGASVGAEAIVAPGVKLWPGRKVPEGGKATASQVTAGGSVPPKFSGSGALLGTLGEEITPELLLNLGSLLGERGQVGLGWAGGDGAGMLARAALAGINAAGGQALVHDGPCPSAGAWVGRYYKLPINLFLWQDGDNIQVRLFGPDGLALTREEQRKLEGALLRGEGSRVPALRVGKVETLVGVRTGYPREAAVTARLSALPIGALAVQVERGEVNDLLAAALEALGCMVSRGSGRGRATFSVDWGGFRLSAWDEEGRSIGPDRIMVLLTRLEMERGKGKITLPAWAPAAAEEVANSFGGKVLRLGRDGEEAMELWKHSPWMWDGIFAACRICERMGST
ncbi:MAG: NDP-sugar synthase, partial [Oscillospiraceae bacterium]|nr:NDP-sugar synthase [Oscillospiraceae bacterium]